MAEQNLQDELALVRKQLETLCQQRRKEAAKQRRNDRLLNILDEDIHRVAAEIQRLMVEHAKWLEAQATGARPRQQMMLWVKARERGKPIQVPIEDGRLNVARSPLSAAPRLGSFWAYILRITDVMMFRPKADTDGQLIPLQTSVVDKDGYAPVDIEALDSLGQSKDSAILLKFGPQVLLPTWTQRARWILIAVAVLAVLACIFRQPIGESLENFWKSPEPPA